MFYLDSSAAMKLVVAETGSATFRAWLASTASTIFSSDLLRTEFLRAVRRSTPARETDAREIVRSLHLVRLSASVCERAAGLMPLQLRSLDALHLAAAMEVGDELEGIVTYDDRLAEAATANGIRVISPA